MGMSETTTVKREIRLDEDEIRLAVREHVKRVYAVSMPADAGIFRRDDNGDLAFHHESSEEVKPAKKRKAKAPVQPSAAE